MPAGKQQGGEAKGVPTVRRLGSTVTRSDARAITHRDERDFTEGSVNEKGRGWRERVGGGLVQRGVMVREGAHRSST